MLTLRELYQLEEEEINFKETREVKQDYALTRLAERKVFRIKPMPHGPIFLSKKLHPTEIVYNFFTPFTRDGILVQYLSTVGANDVRIHS